MAPCLPSFELGSGGQVSGESAGALITFTRAATVSSPGMSLRCSPGTRSLIITSVTGRVTRPMSLLPTGWARRSHARPAMTRRRAYRCSSFLGMTRPTRRAPNAGPPCWACSVTPRVLDVSQQNYRDGVTVTVRITVTGGITVTGAITPYLGIPGTGYSGDSISNSNPSSGSASALTSCFPATQFRCRNPHRLAAAHHDDSGIGLDRGLPSRGSRAAHGCERAAKIGVLGLGQIFLFHGFSLHSSKAGSIPVLSYNAQSLTAIL